MSQMKRLLQEAHLECVALDMSDVRMRMEHLHSKLPAAIDAAKEMVDATEGCPPEQRVYKTTHKQMCQFYVNLEKLLEEMSGCHWHNIFWVDSDYEEEEN